MPDLLPTNIFERREMELQSDEMRSRRVNSIRWMIGLTLSLTLMAFGASAQTLPTDSKSSDCKNAEAKLAVDAKSAESYQTLYFVNAAQQSEANDIVSDLRNILPKAKVILVSAQNAISIHGTAEDIQLAQKIIAEIDRPRKLYRLTFSITDTENGKSGGTQHFVLVAASGTKTYLRQGSRVPIVSGSYNADTTTANSQVMYQDVGLMIEATADDLQNGVFLKSHITQSSLADEKSGMGTQDPIILETVLETYTNLLLGKTALLGSLELPGGTRKLEIEVVAELVK